MRYKFGKELYKQMKKDERIVLLLGDIGYGVFTDCEKDFPERVINVGICEQTMVAMAAGMALQGLKPLVYTITPFLIERAFEMIKVDIDAMKTNVKLIGYCDYPDQGITHRCIDESIMLVFDNIEQFYPIDERALDCSIKKIFETDEPCFMSLKKLK